MACECQPAAPRQRAGPEQSIQEVHKSTVAFPTVRRRPSWLLLPAALTALLLTLVVAASAGAQVTVPTFSRFVPAPNSTVPAGTTTIGANITSDSAIEEINLFLDGQQIEVAEILGPSPEQIAFISQRDLAPGPHTVRVVATDQDGDRNEATWTFTSVAPDRLPRAGGLPLGLALPGLFFLGAAAAAFGLRLRRR